MTLWKRGTFVLGLALAVSLHGGAARADSDEAKPEAPATGTPLVLRKDIAAQTATNPRPPTQTGAVALVALMGLAGVGLWLRGRKAGAPGSSDIRLRVLRRLSVGARNEVLLIEFDGQRILIGSTPNSIQTLVHCNLDAELSEASDATQAPTEAEPVAASERIETANAPPRRPRSTHVARLAPAPQEDLGIEEQARGLRALLGGR